MHTYTYHVTCKHTYLCRHMPLPILLMTVTGGSHCPHAHLNLSIACPPSGWVTVGCLRDVPLTEDASVRTRLVECLETILNRAMEPPKSKKVQHSNAKNAVLFEAINLIIHMDSEPNLLVRACNQLGQFLQHKETNLR